MTNRSDMSEEKKHTTINTSYGGDELLLRSRCDVSETSVLKMIGKLAIMGNHLFDEVNKENVSKERQEKAYNLICLLSDAQKMINSFSTLDSKRMGNNFKYISKIQVLQRENERLTKELETIKNNLI